MGGGDEGVRERTKLQGLMVENWKLEFTAWKGMDIFPLITYFFLVIILMTVC